MNALFSYGYSCTWNQRVKVLIQESGTNYVLTNPLLIKSTRSCIHFPIHFFYLVGIWRPMMFRQFPNWLPLLLVCLLSLSIFRISLLLFPSFLYHENTCCFVYISQSVRFQLFSLRAVFFYPYMQHTDEKHYTCCIYIIFMVEGKEREHVQELIKDNFKDVLGREIMMYKWRNL